MTNDNINILIVEDSQTQALRLQIILENQGYRITTAQNGIEGLNLFKETFFPIVITDWVMPEMDGFEFCKTIRNQEMTGYVYIIILTTKDSKNDINAGFEAGADDYLIKPPDETELAARLKTAKRVITLEYSLRKQKEEIERLSVTDPLTKTYNRRYLSNHLPGAIKHTFRYSRPLSIIICDIDHFKNINDCYGHQAGDYVLEEFAQCIKNIIRDGIDWVARYGGEEFIIVLPETDLDNAKKAAERYRLLLSATELIYETQKIKITASFGVACLFPTEEGRKVNMDSMITAADELLYKAKKEGRNRSFGISLG